MKKLQFYEIPVTENLVRFHIEYLSEFFASLEASSRNSLSPFAFIRNSQIFSTGVTQNKESRSRFPQGSSKSIRSSLTVFTYHASWI